MRRLISAFLIALVLACPRVTAATPQSAAASAVRSVSQEYLFPPGSGLLFFYVRRDKTADFDAIVARLSQALTASTDPARRQQAASWQAFRSIEQVAESAVYVFLFNPVVSGADYDPVKMLAEAMPAETPALYEQLKGAVIRVERMALARMP